jgi:hypothetical protein
MAREPIVLTAEETVFIERVRAYCQDGLNQSEMAKREGASLSAFREKLRRCHLEIETKSERFIVQSRTKVPYDLLVSRGDYVPTETRELAGVA